MTGRWPFTPRGTGALVIAVVFLAVAAALGVAELVYFAVMLVAVDLVSLAALHLARRTETVVRTTDPEVPAAGRSAQVAVEVTVRPTLPTAAGTWRDALPRHVRGRATGGFPAIAAGARARDRHVVLDYEMVPERRGVHRLGPLTVTTGDPFGLARRARTLGVSTTMLVAPAVVELASLPLATGDSGGRSEASDQLGQGADDLVARPWAAGDSMRRIHWRASAHRGELMVRQEERERTPEAVVVLDRAVARWSEAAVSAPGVDPAFERAVSACASIVARLVVDGYAVDVLDGDGSPLVDTIDAGDETAVETFTAGLATLTARRDDGLAGLARSFENGTTGPAIVVTGALGEVDVDLLAPLLAHAGLPVLLAVGHAESALDAAAAFGWRVAHIPPTVDLPAAWLGIVAAEGADV